MNGARSTFRCKGYLAGLALARSSTAGGVFRDGVGADRPQPQLTKCEFEAPDHRCLRVAKKTISVRGTVMVRH